MFKLKSYQELVAMSKEKIDEVMAIPRAMLAQKQGELKMAETDELIATQDQKIQELAIQKKIDFDAMADAIDKLELLQLRRTRFAEILAQLFPKEPK